MTSQYLIARNRNHSQLKKFWSTLNLDLKHRSGVYQTSVTTHSKPYSRDWLQKIFGNFFLNQIRASMHVFNINLIMVFYKRTVKPQVHVKQLCYHKLIVLLKLFTLITQRKSNHSKNWNECILLYKTPVQTDCHDIDHVYSSNNVTSQHSQNLTST